jgi:SNW domain-containing protein 1
MRAKVEKQIAKKQKEDKEERLRELALHARTNRAGIHTTGKLLIYLFEMNDCFFVSDKNDDQSAERDQIRQERQKERQRAAALQRAGGDKR